MALYCCQFVHIYILAYCFLSFQQLWAIDSNPPHTTPAFFHKCSKNKIGCQRSSCCFNTRHTHQTCDNWHIASAVYRPSMLFRLIRLLSAFMRFILDCCFFCWFWWFFCVPFCRTWMWWPFRFHLDVLAARLFQLSSAFHSCTDFWRRHSDGFPRCPGCPDHFTAARYKHPDQPADGTSTQPTTWYYQAITTRRNWHKQPRPTPTRKNPTAPNIALDQSNRGAPADLLPPMSQIATHTNHSPTPSFTIGHHFGQGPHDIYFHFRTIKHASIPQTTQDRPNITYHQSIHDTTTRTTTPSSASQTIRTATPSMAAAHFLSSITLTQRQTHPSTTSTLQITLTTHTQKATSRRSEASLRPHITTSHGQTQ